MAEAFDCRAAARLLSVAQDRALTAGETEALQHHLGLCFMCRNYESQLAFLRAAVQRFRSGEA